MKLNREYSGDLFLDLVLYYFSKLTLALSRIRLTSFTVESSSLLGNFTFVLFSRQLILRLLLRLDEVVIEVGGDLPNVYTAGTSLFIVYIWLCILALNFSSQESSSSSSYFSSSKKSSSSYRLLDASRYLKSGG